MIATNQGVVQQPMLLFVRPMLVLCDNQSRVVQQPMIGTGRESAKGNTAATTVRPNAARFVFRFEDVLWREALRSRFGRVAAPRSRKRACCGRYPVALLPTFLFGGLTRTVTQ